MGNQLTPTGGGAGFGALLAHDGYSFSFKPPLGGMLIVTWYTASSGNSVKPKALARGHAEFLDGHPGRIKIVLTSTGRDVLTRATSLKVTARATFTPIERAAVRTSRTSR